MHGYTYCSCSTWITEIQFLGGGNTYLTARQLFVANELNYCCSIMSIENLSYESWRFLVSLLLTADTCTCMYVLKHACITGQVAPIRSSCIKLVKINLSICACRAHPSVICTWEDCNRTDCCVKCRPNYVWIKWCWILIQTKEMID